jgi:hypothetical protein
MMLTAAVLCSPCRPRYAAPEARRAAGSRSARRGETPSHGQEMQEATGGRRASPALAKTLGRELGELMDDPVPGCYAG